MSRMRLLAKNPQASVPHTPGRKCMPTALATSSSFKRSSSALVRSQRTPPMIPMTAAAHGSTTPALDTTVFFCGHVMLLVTMLRALTKELSELCQGIV